jgi:ribonuclease P protein component
MQLLRLSGRKVCDKVIAKGNVWKGKHILVRWLPGAPPLERKASIDAETLRLYMGTLASTRLNKSAVKRNRMRRRCKEAFRLVLKDHTEGKQIFTLSPSQSFQLLVSPRSSSLSCAFGDIQMDVRRFLSSLR